ncbi:MAG: BON domain-containing protein, partial [Prolixibacteraceae bacterium]
DAVDEENISVEVKDKTVYLKGTIPSYSAKVIALRDTIQVARDYDVENELTVRFQPQQQELTDTEITGNIQNFLKYNSDINPVNLRVETEKGEVTLSGKVAKSWEKREAEKVANAAKGVVNVVNKIEVKPSAIRSDEYIERDLRRVLERSALVDEDKVHVEVENGVVHLTGSVVSEPVLNEINEKALYTNGVVDVINEITIQ